MRKSLLISVLLACFAVGLLANDIKPNGIFNGDLYVALRNMQKAQLDVCMTDPNIGQAASPNSQNIVVGGIQNTLNYTIQGLWRQFAPSSNYALPVPNGELPTQNQSSDPSLNYLICINAEGNPTVDVADDSLVSLVPDDYAPLGYVRIELAAGGSFRIGQTNFDATSVNAKFYDIRMPVSGNSKVSLKDLPRP